MTIVEIPHVLIKRKHWKVGDGMEMEPDKERFVIHQIAVVETGEDTFDIVFYDIDGESRGDIHVKVRK